MQEASPEIPKSKISKIPRNVNTPIFLSHTAGVRDGLSTLFHYSKGVHIIFSESLLLWNK